VASCQSIHVEYNGRPLGPGQQVFWKVRAWDRDDKASAYSETGWWEMGLLAPENWRAAWITGRGAEPTSESQRFDDNPSPLLRKEFTLGRRVSRGRVYVSGLGYYELHLNGQRVGRDVLDPGWTGYSKRVLYSTYDVTERLRRGPNALGIMLGNGWFNPLPLRLWGRLNLREHLTVGEPRAIVQLNVEFADGTSETIATDETWKAGNGPVLRNSVYLGELYDARKEQPGWDSPGFEDSRWEMAMRAPEPLGPLRAQGAPPIHITRILKPVRLTEPKPGVFIFDFGQNFAGWARLHVKGSAGTQVRMRYGELLYTNGTLNGLTAVCGQIKQGGPAYEYPGAGAPKTAWQMDEYVLKGESEGVYTPRFTFHGFRYVEVTDYPGKPTLNALEGLRLNSDVTSVGTFACSNDRLNRIQQMVLWTELSNLFSVQSDCPHREKFGYGGDLAVSSEMGMFNFDMSRFYAKAVLDLAEAARPNGGITETAPYIGLCDQSLGDKTLPVDLGEESGPIDFGTAQPLLTWQLYEYYGDRRLLQEQYQTTKRWIALLQSKAPDGLLDNGISDHESLAPKPRALTGTALFYFNVKLFSQIARVLGHESDAVEAAALAEKIKLAFNQKFLKAGTGRYDTATQACQSYALHLGLVPDAEKDHALEVLVRDVREVHHGHLSTGIFGTKYMLNALTDSNRAEVAYEMVNQRTFPGWGYMLDNGATTLWEHWAGSDNTHSLNHPMFGSVSEWFYKALAGISPAPDAVGFDHILLRPQPVGDLKWVKASYDSVRGKIVSEWTRERGRFDLHVQVPVGTTATVILPIKGQGEVTESGRALERATGVKLVRFEDGKAILSIGSGKYSFSSGG
jgi:alpha-L-rhamnosidase